MTLLTEKKGSSETLADTLISQGVINNNAYISALQTLSDEIDADETPVQQTKNEDTAYKQQTQESEDITQIQQTQKSEDTTYKKQSSSSTNPSSTPASYTYVLNKNTKKFHRPGCRAITQMKESNKIFFDGTAEQAESKGYVKCKICF